MSSPWKLNVVVISIVMVSLSATCNDIDTLIRSAAKALPFATRFVEVKVFSCKCNNDYQQVVEHVIMYRICLCNNIAMSLYTRVFLANLPVTQKQTF